MINNPKNVAVVGGGSAGYVAALILKTKFPECNVTMIRSSKIGIIGVGEGSTEHWSDFMNFVGIDPRTLVRETDATYKSGIMFKGWGKQDYLQSIGDGFNLRYQGYPYMYAHQISRKSPPEELVSPLAWNSRANIWFIGKDDQSQVMQYHFNTHKLNDFLESFAASKGIEIIDDEIIDVSVNENGISGLTGNKQKYLYDFYIDSTGFSRILISKLGAEWESYSKYLKMKSALVFPLENQGDIPMWTLAQAMDAGWMFRLPVWGRYGNGYIFDSDHITADQAKAEIDKFFGVDIDVKRQINFDPGALKNTWIKNCCAVGLSSSFVEPLEASSIGTSIQQSFLLTEYLVNYDDRSISRYNKTVTDILSNIRDFLVLHYLGGRTDSEFWRSVQQTDIPDSLRENLETWKHKLPSTKDFQDVTNKILFTDLHFILILNGLGLLNVDSIREEYHRMVPYDRQEEADRIIRENRSAPYLTVPHKTMLEVLRSMKEWPSF